MISKEGREREEIYFASVWDKSGGAVGGDRAFRRDHRQMEITTRLHHYSTLAYAVPAERVSKILPEGLEAAITIWNGEEVGWVRVHSFRDEGGDPAKLRSISASGFEQTTYSVEVQSDTGSVQYLLGQSIGSLSAVSLRHLWAQPWHLSAMEFAVVWQFRGCHQYRLQSQSQWDNSRWDLRELTGSPLVQATRTAARVPSGLLAVETTHLFSRGEDSFGQRQVRYDGLSPQWVSVVGAQSDFLERSGLVTREELQRPVLAGVQQTVKASMSLADGEFLVPTLPETSRAALVRAA
jgi:hypothetical protein